jgi:WD40 repeat protein/tetratricopeptide (TPR) repeat protein
MSKIDALDPAVADQRPAPFATMEALKAEHAELLRRRRFSDNAPEFLAEVRAFLRRGGATGVNLEGEGERLAAENLLTYWATILCRTDSEEVEVALAEFDAAQAPPLDDSLNPYLDLASPAGTSADRFLGWKRLFNESLQKLEEHRFCALVGASGSGRTALLQGGILPAIRHGKLPGSESWACLAPLTPCRDLLLTLARLVEPAGAAATWAAEQAAAMRQSGGRLAQILSETRIEPVVLIITGFEELFLTCGPEERRAFLENLAGLLQAPESEHRVLVTIRIDYLSFVAPLEAIRTYFREGQVLLAFTTGEYRQLIEEPARKVGLKFDEGLVDRLLLDVQGDPGALALLQFTLLRLWEHRQQNRFTHAEYDRLGGGRVALQRVAEELYQKWRPEERDATRHVLLCLARPSIGADVSTPSVRLEDLVRGATSPEGVDRVLQDLTQARLLKTRDEGGVSYFQLAFKALATFWPQLVEWLSEERENERRRLRLRAAAEQWRDSRYEDSLLNWVMGTWARVKGTVAWKALAAFWLRLVMWIFARDPGSRRHRLTEAAEQGHNSRQNPDVLWLTATWARLSRSITWRSQRRDPRLLWVGPALAAVRDYTGLDELQRRFLDASKKEEKRRTFLTKVSIAFVLVVAFIVCGLFVAWSNAVAETAKKEKKQEAQRLALMSLGAGMNLTMGQQNAEDDVAGAVVWYGRALKLLQENKDVLSPEEFEMVDRNIRFRLTAAWRRLPRLNQFIHHEGLMSVDISPDAQWAATGSKDGTIRLWDLQKDSAKPRDLPKRNAPVSDVRFSPRGDYLVTANGGEMASGQVAGGEVQVWRVSSGASVAGPFQLKHSANQVAFSDRGDRLLAVSNREKDNLGIVYVWECQNGSPVGEPKKVDSAQGVVNWAEFNLDGTKLVMAIENRRMRTGSVMLWDAVTGKPVPQGEKESPDKRPLVYACFGPGDEQLVLTCSGKEGDKDGQAVLWNVANGLESSSLSIMPHDGAVSHAAFGGQGGRKVITCGFDGKARIWDRVGNEVGRSPLELSHGGPVYRAGFSPDGRYVCTGCRDRKVRVWDAKSGEPILTPLYLGKGTVDMVAFLKDGSTIAAWSVEGQAVRIWKLLADDSRTLTFKTSDPVSYATFYPEAKRVVTVTRPSEGLANDEVRVWNTRGEPVTPPLRHPPGVTFAAMSQDGHWLLTMGREKVARLWGITEREFEPKMLHLDADSPVRFAAFSPDGRRLVVLDGGKDALLWDLHEGDFKPKKLSLDVSTFFAAFSPDGRRVVVTGGEKGGQVLQGKARIWDAETGVLVAKLPKGDDEKNGHTEMVSHAAFSGDGLRVVTSSEDNRARIWDAETGAPILFQGEAVILKHTANVNQAAFSPNGGKYVVTASMDCTAAVWDAYSGDNKLSLNHPSWVESAWFSPKGHHMVTVGHDQVLRFWDLRAGMASVERGKPDHMVVVLKQSGTILRADLRLASENTGILTVLSYLNEETGKSLVPRNSLSGSGSARRIQLKEWTFTKDDRPPDQVLEEGELLAHRRVDESLRLTLMTNEELAKVWKKRKQQYEGVPARPELDIHMQEADKAEAAKQWAAARWHLDRLIDSLRDRPDLLVRRAECHHQEAQQLSAGDAREQILNKALEDYNAALEVSEEATYYAGRARIQVELRKFETALSDFEQAVDLSDAEDRQLHIDKANLHEKRGGLGVRYYSQSLDKGNPPLTNEERTELSKAIQEYTKATKLDEKFGVTPGLRLLRARALLYRLTEQWEKAVEDYSMCINSHPIDIETANLHLQRARARAWITGQTSQAAEDFEEAAQVYDRLNKIPEAGMAYQSAIPLAEKLTDPLMQSRLRAGRGLWYLKQNQFAFASNDFKRAIELDRDNWRAYEGKGRTDYRQGRWPEAAMSFERAAGIAPEELQPPLWQQLGQTRERLAQTRKNLREWEYAVEAYSKALRLQKRKDPGMLQSRGRIYVNLQQWAKAAEDYREVTQLLPANYLQLRFLLQEQSWAFVKAGRIDEAFAAYDKAIDSLPANDSKRGLFLQDAARVYAYAGRSDKSLEAYGKVIDTLRPSSPQLSTLLQDRGRVYFCAGLWKKAVEAYGAAIEMLLSNTVPTSGGQLRALLQDQARAYGKLDRWGEALGAYDRVISKLPEKDWQLTALLQDKAWVLGGAGHWEEAIKEYERVRGMGPLNAYAYGLQAQAHAELGQWTQAKEILETASKQFSFDPSAQGYLARVYLKLGDEARYREIRANILKRFGQTTNAGTANNAAWAIVLKPEKGDNLSVAIALAERAVTLNPTNYNYLNTLGAAYYRVGNYDKAILRLKEASEKYVDSEKKQLRPVDENGRADDLFLLAMAYAKKNEMDKAKQALDHGVRWFQKYNNLTDPQSLFWTREDRQLLRDEAEKLISR